MTEAQFVTQGHLGGYIRSNPDWPHGDPATWCPALWDWMIKAFRPTSMLDVGCGEGHAVRYFNDHGVQGFGVDGIDSRSANVLYPHELIVHDFTSGSLDVAPVDLIWSCEFVEHVDAQYVENFLKTFDKAKVVFMTHAEPGQGGYHHVNLQPAEYWIDKMHRRGFRFQTYHTPYSRKFAPGTHWARSGLIFMKGT